MATSIQDNPPFPTDTDARPGAASARPVADTETSYCPTDARLMRCIADGDEQALVIVYDRYAQAIYALALRIVRQPDTAEEIVQETLMRVWRAAPTFDSESGRFPAWLFRITRNRCIDHLRCQRARGQFLESVSAEAHAEAPFDEMADPSVDVAGAAGNRVQRGEIQQVMSALPTAQRRALELAYFEGLTHREIAELLDEPLGTVKTRLRLGLARLATLFDSATL